MGIAEQMGRTLQVRTRGSRVGALAVVVPPTDACACVCLLLRANRVICWPCPFATSPSAPRQRTSISVNIKERLDFSCALFGPDGGLVANAPHIPVHLGAMQVGLLSHMARMVQQRGSREVQGRGMGAASEHGGVPKPLRPFRLVDGNYADCCTGRLPALVSPSRKPCGTR
jgi:hypothetical protein